MGGDNIKKLPTKDIIAYTLLDLLQSKRIEAITVSWIAKEVGVSTRTFYNCFRDKFDVCNYIYDRLLDRCWITAGQRSTLNQFFEHLMDAINGDYSAFFHNTICYNGQSNINEYIVHRGTEDLKEQLRRTGHGDMITPENILRLKVYMMGLSATLKIYNSAPKSVRHELTFINKAELLPKPIYDALTSPIIHTAP